jgi:hypothetical protein
MQSAWEDKRPGTTSAADHAESDPKPIPPQPSPLMTSSDRQHQSDGAPPRGAPDLPSDPVAGSYTENRSGDIVVPRWDDEEPTHQLPRQSYNVRADDGAYG